MRKRKMGEDGQAMVEFAITFPILLLLVLSIIQIAIMANTAAMVNYAAFCGARTAAVFIPRYDVGGILGLTDDGPNEISYFKKYGKIHLAVAMALAPVSPPFSEVGLNIPGISFFAGILNGLYSSIPSGAFGDIANGFDRFTYAYIATSGVDFGQSGVLIGDEPHDLDAGTGSDLANRGDITIRVKYLMNLRIPVANACLSQFRQFLIANLLAGGREHFWMLEGLCTIQNEGACIDSDYQVDQ
ncbi:TadE/TadG family type IV pilus assembly protein [candidate division CSSED10-310 bacterium]|uniref:TadE/TadG family type IV pilus assembly protein n=1 Tax=candidate division CSSED10-310 bacterium TaxID=2855610 RepID=A0ABV6Z0H8_UNCC1